MTRLVLRARNRRAEGDAGVSLIEMMVALVIIAIVSAASAAFIVNDIRGVDGQKQRQQATYIADQALEKARAIDPTYVTATTRSKLVSGRTKTAVQALLASAPASALSISTQDDVSTSLSLAWDPTATAASTQVIPTTTTSTINGTTYTTYNFVDVCWLSGSTSLTAGQASTCGPTQATGTTEDYRVTTDVTWKGKGTCSTGCDYSNSTLIDPTIDQQFNNNVSLPNGTLTSPSSGQTIIDNPGSLQDGACAISGQTGDLMTITGNNFQSGLSVKISAGGGTLYNVLQPTAGTITFCLTTASNPGQYTITVINPDFGLFKVFLTEEPYISSVSGYNKAAKTVVLTGDGFEADSTVACSGLATCSGGSQTSATSFTVTNYTPPTNSGVGKFVVTNPDDSTLTAVYSITAPNISLPTPLTVRNKTVTVTFSGSSFATGTSMVASTTASPAPTITLGSASASSVSATITVPSTYAASTFPITFTNPDGSSDTENVTVDPLPTITSWTTSVSSIRRSTTFSPLTVNGTGFSIIAPGPVLTANWTGPSPSTASVNTTTVLVLASSTTATYTVTAPATTGTYTLKITITNPDTGSVVGTTTKTMTVTP